MTIARARVPKQVGRYQLVHELAPSYLGPLWAARIDGGDTLAMLRLVSLVRLEADVRVRLLEAAWQAMEVRDDRVAAVTDVVASDGELSIVSEYAEGLPLRAALALASVRRKAMPVPVALRFILDLTDGVIALHRAMTELGDEAVPLFGGLSVDSVLVGVNGRASLLDVSIASAASSVDSLGGTPERAAYAAPEQISGSSAIDARTDVFSLGIMAWEMLSNRRLFVGSDKAVAQKVLAAKVPKLEDPSRKGNLEVPKPLAAAVLRALSLDPLARFESMEAFRAALDAAGVAIAAPEEAAIYVAAIADGALARTRDALSLPPKPRTSDAPPAPTRTETRTMAQANPAPMPGAATARATIEPKALTLPGRAGTETRPVPARPSVDPRPTTKLGRPATARPSVDPKPGPRPSIDPKPAAVARPSIDPKPAVVARLSIDPKPAAVARPSIDPKPAPEARQSLEPGPVADARRSEEPRSVTTSQRVSIEPKPGDGWRSLEAPPSARSVPPARVRPRQVTMIGLPPPAGLRPDATPPAEPVAPSEPPPSSDGSDEPTGQYSREHLRQLSELRGPPPPSTAPPPQADVAVPAARSADQTPFGPPVVLGTPPALPVPSPTANAKPAGTSAAREVVLPRLVSLQPTPRPLSEIHTERPPPPEPEPLPTPPTPHVAPAMDSARIAEVARAFDHATSSPLADRFGGHPVRAAAPLPPASAEAEPVRVAKAPPPARMDSPSRASHTAPFAATETAAFTAAPILVAERSLPPLGADALAAGAGRATERPAFSRPPPAASYFPSQMSPPLIHDPRANRMAPATPRQVPQFTRGVLLGVLVSLGLVVASAAVALFFMTGHDDAAAEKDVGAAVTKERGTSRADSLVAAPNSEPAAPRVAPVTPTKLATAAPADPASAASSAAPEDPTEATRTVDDGIDETAQPGATPGSPAASTTTRAMSRTPSRAAHPSRASRKPTKKAGRFVPDDI